MRILIDQQPVDAAVGAGQSLAEVLEQVRVRVAGQQRIVGRVSIDGQQVSPEQLEEWQNRPADGVGQMDIETACPRALARETLKAVGALLGDSSQLQQGAADKLSAGQTGKDMELLLGCLNLHKAAQETVSQVVRLTRLDPNQLRIGGSTAPDTLERALGQLAEQLLAVKSALEARDFVLLGDLLNYEFPKSTQQWQAILAELDAALEVPSAKGEGVRY